MSKTTPTGEEHDASDHQQIRTTSDRTATLRLLDMVILGEPLNTSWTDALETLRWLEDYRSIEPLRAFVENVDGPPDARTAVARTLASFDLTTTAHQRAFWWASGDQALREFSLQLMETSEADIVISVATQDDHPLQAIAIATLSFRFEHPQAQAAVVRGLQSDRNDVQLAAVSSVIWDEPLAAEPMLRDLLDSEVQEVAQAAADALQYYPSLETLACLRQKLDTPIPVGLQQAAKYSIEFIEETIDSELDRCGQVARQELNNWASAIGIGSENINRDIDKPTRPATKARVDPATGVLVEALDTTVGSAIEKYQTLRSMDWSKVPVPEREMLATQTANHPDPEVRTISTVPLAQWNETALLRSLAEDDHALVRKAAMYALADVPISSDVADFALSRLNQLSGADTTETLTTFAKHADPAQLCSVLFQLASDDYRFSVRHTAIRLLDEASMEAEVQSLLPLLHQPPFVNWAVHIALLETKYAKFADRDVVQQLAAIDNIHVAAAAARVLESQPT